MTTFRAGWHVVYVKSRYEKRVHESLQEIAIESFLPLGKVVRNWSDRKKIIEKPLFPSYVFVNINSSMDFYRALSVNGVSIYIRFGKEYALVSDKDILIIKSLLNLDGASDFSTSEILPNVGEIRKVNYGPLNGLECEVVRIDNSDRILVRVDSLRKNISLTISPKYLSDPIPQ